MKQAATFFALCILLTGGLAAQDFSGTVETGLGWFWRTPELMPLVDNEEFSPTFVGGIEGKVGNPELPSAQYSAKLKVAFDPTTAASSVELGEAWIKVFAGPFDISMGNQVVAWSISDAFWPSDVVNPLDLSLPVDPVKTPVPLGRVLYNGKSGTIDLVVQPFWVAAVLPASRWLSESSLPPGITVTEQTQVNSPDFVWDNVAYGGHAKASLDILQGLDLGATFYRGRSSTPRVTSVPTYTGPTTLTLATTLDYDRFTLVGADLVLAPGAGLLVKSEWGYTTLRDSSLLEPEAGAASLEGVSGLEYNVGGVRLIGEYVFDWTKGSVGMDDTIGHSVVVIASTDIGSRISLKVAAIHEFKGNSGMIAPQVSYIIADGLQLNCGMFFFYGDSDTTYGAWIDNSLGRLSLKYAF